MTTFRSSQHGITDHHLATWISSPVADEITLVSIQLAFSGHGHYKIKSKWLIDGVAVTYVRTTSNMQLIDAWKAGMVDLYEDGDDGFDNWQEVVDTMLALMNPTSEIEQQF